jgi:hypothetical protein
MEAYEIKKNRDGHIGYAVILNNFDFKPRPRRGSDKDAANVAKSLEQLHFKVARPALDLTEDKMSFFFKTLADYVDFSDFSCLVCVVMSNGGENGEIHGINSKSIDLYNDIIRPFKDCEQLLGKPKLFFVQACRNNNDVPMITVDKKEEEAIDTRSLSDYESLIEFDRLSLVNDYEADSHVTSRRNSFLQPDTAPVGSYRRGSVLQVEPVASFRRNSNLQVDAAAGFNHRRNSSRQVVIEIPDDEPDILVHYATVEKYVSLRYVIEGSCFIRSLCFVLDKYAATDCDELVEIERIIKVVNHRVTFNYKCQAPKYASSLSKEFYFKANKPD